MESKEVVEKMDAAAGEARKELDPKPSMRHPTRQTGRQLDEAVVCQSRIQAAVPNPA